MPAVAKNLRAQASEHLFLKFLRANRAKANFCVWAACEISFDVFVSSKKLQSVFRKRGDNKGAFCLISYAFATATWTAAWLNCVLFLQGGRK